jgi:hypothetical protein
VGLSERLRRLEACTSGPSAYRIPEERYAQMRDAS